MVGKSDGRDDRKKYLKNAFEKYCEILTVEVNDEKAKNFDKLTIIKNEIVNNYYFHDVEEAEGYHFVIGRQALIALLTLLESDKVLEKIVSNYFWIYMMARRRMLLEQCLNEERDLYKNVNKVCRLLRASSDEWMTLYYRISAYYRGLELQKERKCI